MVSVLRRSPLVSICIPAYRSQDFILETLQSALGQTLQDFEIIISNDGAHPTPALDVCRGHKNCRIFENPSRLGWVQNSNFVLSKAVGQYFMILPHDDRLNARYVEACLQVLESDRYCFAAYSDIATDTGVMTASEVRGDIVQRVRTVMSSLYNGYSYRALMRRRPQDWERLKLIQNLPTNFSVDTTWMLQQAGFGELRRVPEALYWKGFPQTNTHSKWRNLSQQQLRDAWTKHCTQMGVIASSLLADKGMVSALVAHRLDARNVAEAPLYLKNAMNVGERNQAG